ncbi:helix-turn-helix domain-containing protein [Spirosoma sp. HMF4905]|uniref:Helix-turn-helix domain-containing protein n=1 Tax=Spirosoma arboris TaxID=2682092 RepID=A0A7K1S7J1_9BACT|nr:helix-turn-helix domain-containing protein [Spirosoma arboris]MVM29745.1 helix-turn-helix domain-containing protein [Spirosoma arboris]
MKQYQHPTVDQISLTCVLHALSDPVRLNFVQCLAQLTCEQPCGAIPTPVAKSTMSHHLRVLREAGIIQIRTEGTQSLTSLRSHELETKFPGVLDSVLKAASSTSSVEEV